jgi:YD repeat-containing protein
LIQIQEPPDVVGGQQATTGIAYDGSSRIQTITDAVSRQVQFAYDERDRNVTITYGDTSTEKFYYGAQGTGNENLLVKSKDRNGVTTAFAYDAAGRRKQQRDANH